jgi:glycosyltransferase involved in cell wall biosynthesis
MVVAFSLMVHTTADERVSFQEAKTFQYAGAAVSIFSTYFMDVERDEKMEWLKMSLMDANPDVIICDTPLAVKVAYEVKKAYKKEGKSISVIYDVTEWYPSKKNLRNQSFFTKILKFFTLSVLSFLAGVWSDAFIFGEYYKSVPFRWLFPWKKHLFLSYYASTNSVKRYEPQTNLKKLCRMYYSGNLTVEKGFFRVLEVAKMVAEQRGDTEFVLNVVSNSEPIETNKLPSNLKLNFQPWQRFKVFCEEVGDNDLYFDLRDNDIENRHCLPIKLFYYMSAGRPVIYSDLKAIRKGVPECEQFGFFHSEKDLEGIANLVLKYVDDEELYQTHCRNSLNLSKEKYNWELIEDDLIKFVRDVV